MFVATYVYIYVLLVYGGWAVCIVTKWHAVMLCNACVCETIVYGVVQAGDCLLHS